MGKAGITNSFTVHKVSEGPACLGRGRKSWARWLRNTPAGLRSEKARSARGTCGKLEGSVPDQAARLGAGV